MFEIHFSSHWELFNTTLISMPEAHILENPYQQGIKILKLLMCLMHFKKNKKKLL